MENSQIDGGERKGNAYLIPDQRLKAIEQKQVEAEEREARNKKYQLRLAVGLFIVGALGLPIALWQSASASRAAAAAESAAEAARMSADSAFQQVDAMRDANELAEAARLDNIAAVRAELSFQFTIVAEPTVEENGIVGLPITNDRPTAAQNIRVKILAGVSQGSGPPVFTEERWDTPWQEFEPVLGRERGRILTSELAVPRAQVDRYISGQDELYVFLRAQYCDVFGQPHSFHRTWYRVRTRPSNEASIYSTETDNEEEQDRLVCAS